MDDNLEPTGNFGVLLPFHRWEFFDLIADFKGFQLTEKLFVKQSPRHSFFRAILNYSRTKENVVPEHHLTIQKEDGSYTADFVKLMRDYYFYL
jgi:tRNA1Val (adenine37-N6)-methyltransferase